MVILGVVFGVLAGIGIGAVVASLVVRRAQQQATATAAADREAARVASEVAAVRLADQLNEQLSERIAEQAADLEAGFALERERMLQALMLQFSTERETATQTTIDTVLAVAGDKLGSQTAAASSELGFRGEVIDQKIGGMNDELRRVSDLVTALQKDRAEQHVQLVTGIDQAVRASTELSRTTQSLREALSNSRARGQWGERMAEDVLRSAGFIEGVNYRRQQTLEGGRRPDLTFLLPRDRVLHMDVKFPIDNYLRVLDASTDAERDVFAKAFLKDVRLRIKELTGRDYRDPDTTVGFVLLFIPNEAVYSFIHEHDASLLDHALGQQVVLCSPFTLFAVLGVVRQAVDTFLLERTSDEILECLNGFTKQWEAFSVKLDRLGQQFTTAHNSYDELAGTRRRVLQKQLDRVERLRSARSLDELEELGDDEGLDVLKVVDVPATGPAVTDAGHEADFELRLAT